MKLPDIALPGALALTALLACFQNSEAGAGMNKHVYGGASATKGDFPWQAFLHILTPEETIGKCGGTIISSTWILTAAHCHSSYLPRKAIVGGVKYNGEDAEKIITEFTHFIKHDNYIPYTEDPYSHIVRNDIALLGLAEELHFSDNMRPARLPSYSQPALLPGTVVYASGFGNVFDYRDDLPPQTLQYVDLTLTYEENCIKSHLLCATATDRGLKDGDSGGPWIWKDQEGVDHIVGVAATINGAITEGSQISRATNIYYNLDWISSTTGIQIDN